MPTYQYVCNDCGTDLEAVQSFSDPSLTECPTCGGKLRKKFGAVGVVFKGSGFYRTDSRSDRSGAPASESSGSSEKSADKPAEKAPAKTESSSGSGSSSSSGSSGSGDSSSSSSSSSSSGSSPKAPSAA